MNTAFDGYHPAVNIMFFAGAIAMGMFFTHPVFLCVSAAASALYYLLLTHKSGMGFLFGMLLTALCVSFINPFLNTTGDTVLFTYLNARPFTLEALLYGFATGGMFFSMLMWFASFNIIMTSEKFIFIFGALAPALSLMLTMILRLVPSFKRKARSIAAARKCIGKAPKGDTKKDALENSMSILSVLTSWALENAVITADSMKSRGYGSAKRSCFAQYKLKKQDITAIIIMLAAAVLIASGGAVGGVGYAAFLLLPSIIHVKEELTWLILKSRI